jgi:hypothetical protein
MLVGSAINIWFNVTNIDPMLTPGQRALFLRLCPLQPRRVSVLRAMGAWLLLSLARAVPASRCGRIADTERSLRARRRHQPPWYLVGLAAIGWGLTPVFLAALRRLGAARSDALYNFRSP